MPNRNLALAGEALVYGPSYGYLNWMIRSPEPLDPDKAWEIVTDKSNKAAVWIAKNYPPTFTRGMLLANKRRQDARHGIAAHYDVSNDFYKLFLDKKYMFYTCADFVRGDETIEEAQTNKANFIFKLLDPKPGEKILELGCGWGAMLKRIYESTGDKDNLYGYTLSSEQVAYNEQHNGFHVKFQNFVEADYPEASFDKIYSIGAWEHVRPHESQRLMPKLYKGLKPGGRVVHHFFCRFSESLPASAIVSQIFFPGAINASFRFHRQVFEDAGFRLTHISVHDYRPTLRAWFERLKANREEAVRLVGVETYNRFIVFFPASWRYFDDGIGTVFRFVLEKR